MKSGLLRVVMGVATADGGVICGGGSGSGRMRDAGGPGEPKGLMRGGGGTRAKSAPRSGGGNDEGGPDVCRERGEWCL